MKKGLLKWFSLARHLKNTCDPKIETLSMEILRWHQRLTNYTKAFLKLEEAVQRIEKDYPILENGNLNSDAFLDDIIKEGLIQRFEYTHELAWNVMKDFLENARNNSILGSKDATREAFALGLIENGEVWMDMIVSRNKTTHTYNEETADDIFLKIVHQYYREFQNFKNRMEELHNRKQEKRL